MWILKQKRVSQQTKIQILNFLLESVNAVPIRNILEFESDGTLKVGGKTLDPQSAINLRESVISLSKNYSDRIITEQITFEAIKIGLHIGQTTDQIMFSKAAIWVLKQREELITKLIGQNINEDL